MTTTTIVLAVLTAAAFPLLLWAIGRTVTAIASQAPPARGRPHQYLAGRLDGVQITTVVTGQDELLITLTTQAANPTRATTAATPTTPQHTAPARRIRSPMGRG